MKKLLLVRPNGNNRFQIVPPLGLLYVAKAAENAGYEVTVYDAWLKNESPFRAAESISKTVPYIDIIGVQLYYDTVEWAGAFIGHMRHYYPGTHIVVGGPQASAFGWKAARETGADSAHIGPGELMFGNDILDIPAWHLINLPDYWPHMQSATVPIKGKRPAVIQTSRGCPHLCTFCAGHVVHGRTVQMRTPESVMKEIRMLGDRFKVDEIWIQDDNFLHDRERANDIFWHMAKRSMHVRFPNGIRCEKLCEHVVYRMKNAGVYFVGIGIESGSQRVLREVKKGLRLDTVRRAVELFHRYGIMTSGFFIVGLPPEREENVKESISFACSLPLDRIQVGTWIPYPGSEDFGKVSGMDNTTLRRWQRVFTLRFYLRPRILWSLLRGLRWSQVKALFRHPFMRGK